MIIGTIRQFMPKQGGVPIGGIVAWNGEIADIPRGFFLCDGTNDTPDLSDQFVLGSSTTYPIDSTGGEESVTLLEANMPEHDHPVNVGNGGAHSHSYSANDVATGSGYVERAASVDGTGTTGSQDWPHTHTSVTLTSEGSNQSHNNMPPYVVLAYIMRGK